MCSEPGSFAHSLIPGLNDSAMTLKVVKVVSDDDIIQCKYYKCCNIEIYLAEHIFSRWRRHRRLSIVPRKVHNGSGAVPEGSSWACDLAFFSSSSFFACQLRAQSCTLMIIIPLSHYDNFATTFFRKQKLCRQSLPPPPPPTPTKQKQRISLCVYAHVFSRVSLLA